MPVIELIATKGSKKRFPNSYIGGGLQLYKDEEHPVCSSCNEAMPVVVTLDFDALPFAGMTPFAGYFRVCACTTEYCAAIQKKEIPFETLYHSDDSERTISENPVTKYKPYTYTSQRFGDTDADSYLSVGDSVTIKIGLTPLAICIERKEKIYRFSSLTIESQEGTPVLMEYVFSTAKRTPKPMASSEKSTPLKKKKRDKESPSVLTQPAVLTQPSVLAPSAEKSYKSVSSRVQNFADLVKSKPQSQSPSVSSSVRPEAAALSKPSQVSTPVLAAKPERQKRPVDTTESGGWKPAPALVRKVKKDTRKTNKERRKAFWAAEQARKAASNDGEGGEGDQEGGEGDQEGGEGDQEGGEVGEGDNQ